MSLYKIAMMTKESGKAEKAIDAFASFVKKNVGKDFSIAGEAVAKGSSKAGGKVTGNALEELSNIARSYGKDINAVSQPKQTSRVAKIKNMFSNWFGKGKQSVENVGQKTTEMLSSGKQKVVNTLSSGKQKVVGAVSTAKQKAKNIKQKATNWFKNRGAGKAVDQSTQEMNQALKNIENLQGRIEELGGKLDKINKQKWMIGAGGLAAGGVGGYLAGRSRKNNNYINSY